MNAGSVERSVEKSPEKPAEKGAEKGAEGKVEKIPFWRVVLSVIQASFGVQSRENRERDFKQGSWLPYVIAALLFTTLFVLVLMFVVKLVLSA